LDNRRRYQGVSNVHYWQASPLGGLLGRLDVVDYDFPMLFNIGSVPVWNITKITIGIKTQTIHVDQEKNRLV
jgi:hypothetical protein